MVTGPGSQRPAAIAAEAAKSIHFMGGSPGWVECERREQTMKSDPRSIIMFMLYSQFPATGSPLRRPRPRGTSASGETLGGGPWGEGEGNARFRDRARL